ncbi:MAG TPA: SPASM domain-containing protein, partial [Phycisphaeraceae bacterium]
HDAYRHDTRGEGSSDRVLTTLDLLRRYGVEFNILCVLTDRNVEHPDELLGFFLNRGIHWLQFIPAVEWEEEPTDQPPRLARFSPSSEAYGRFLCRLFDLWFERYRHYVSIRFFDSVIAKMVMDEMPLCILGGSCHTQLTIEHDGSVFGCDHFVEPRWRLGQVDGVDWMARLDQPRLTRFAQGKQRVPPTCLACPWYRFCYGGCPKHRPHRGDEAHAPAASVLCEGYRAFYAHAMPRLEWLCGYLRQNRLPPPPQQTPSAAPRSVKPGRFAPQEQVVPMRVPRNAPCPCGSGRKFKRCHGAGWR